MDPLYVLPLLFFVVAFLYSMVGFGGGSSYLAILSSFQMAFPSLRATALLCNILVVSNNLFNFSKKGHLPIKKGLYFSIPSVPFAFLGASLKITEHFFFQLLGITLFIAALITFFKEKWVKRKSLTLQSPIWMGLFGSALGLLSGMVGIGGGIFLAPLLFIFSIVREQNIPPICSLFILLNSLAALGGQSLSFNYQLDFLFIGTLLFAVFLGSSLGANFSIKHINERLIRKMTSVLIAGVSISLIISHF